jgi:hypothetical protein
MARGFGDGLPAMPMACGFGDGLPAMPMACGFDEFDHVALIHHHRPQWQDHRVMARDLAAFTMPAKTFQVEFVAAVQRWASGRFDHEYAESRTGFKARVLAVFNNDSHPGAEDPAPVTFR